MESRTYLELGEGIIRRLPLVLPGGFIVPLHTVRQRSVEDNLQQGFRAFWKHRRRYELDPLLGGVIYNIYGEQLISRRAASQSPV